MCETRAWTFGDDIHSELCEEEIVGQATRTIRHEMRHEELYHHKKRTNAWVGHRHSRQVLQSDFCELECGSCLACYFSLSNSIWRIEFRLIEIGSKDERGIRDEKRWVEWLREGNGEKKLPGISSSSVEDRLKLPNIKDRQPMGKKENTFKTHYANFWVIHWQCTW